MKKGLTISIVFEACSANFGEGFGNIATIKKLTRSGGKSYSYISRQALRYNIVEQMGCDNTPVSVEQKVVQFTPDSSIKDYAEIDLFGYMKTVKKVGAATRSAVVRLSHAVSLEPFAADLDFQTNMGLAKRIAADNAIAQSEVHKSLYAYTIAIDLDRLGIDTDASGNVTTEIGSSDKVKRLTDFLDTIQNLYRDIRGRRENLSPLFAIGGIYDRKSPFFEDRIKLSGEKLEIEIIKDILESSEDLKANTLVAFTDGTFSNSEQIKEALKPTSVAKMFTELKEKVKVIYA